MKCQFSRLVVAVSACLLLLSVAHIQAQEGEEIPQVPLEEAATDNSEERVVVYPDQREDEAAADEELAEQAQVLQLRAGEFGEGRANIMGMYTKELEPGRVIVTEVGAATPAFEAGIREGDEIISFDGFEADTYRKWIDGMRKLANAASEGDTLPMRVRREGEVLTLRLRKPTSGTPIRLPNDDTLQQQITQDVPAGQVPLQPGPPMRGRGGADIINAPFFGGTFGDRLGGTTDRAMAVIVRLGPAQPQAQVGAGGTADRTRTLRRQVNRPGLATQKPPVVDGSGQQNAAAATANGAGQQIGLAGFRNTQSGMLVMLDVGGLAPGNYQVGIDDASALTAGANIAAGQSPVVAPPGQRQTPPPSAVPPQAPGETPIGDNPSNDGAAPQSTPADTGQPQSQLPQPRTTVLAQVSSATAETGTAESGAAATDTRTTGAAGAPNTPSVSPPAAGVAPATGQVERADTGRSQANELLDEQGRRNPELRNEPRRIPDGAIGAGVGVGGINRGAIAGGATMLVPVGMLTVDESGTGRLQQMVEGLQVADVVGQAIVIHSQGAQPGVAMPPNLDVGAEPLQRVPAGRQPQVSGAPGGAVPPPQGNIADLQQDQRQGVGGLTAQPPQPGAIAASRPVAGGIIRMMPDGLGAEPAGGGEPAARLPATEQELR